MTVAQTVNVDS